MRKGIIGVTAAMSIALFTSRAAGDSLTVTSGSVNLSPDFNEGAIFSFVGNGFTIDQSLVEPFEPFRLDTAHLFDLGCLIHLPGCQPGVHYDLNQSTDGRRPLGRVGATVGGTTFDAVDLFGELNFSSPGVVIPPLPRPGSTDFNENYPTIRAPFSFTGALTGFSEGQQVFALDLKGRGTVSSRLARSRLRLWLVDEAGAIVYQFDDTPTPTPEPGTLFLLGGGLVAAVTAGRRGHSSRLSNPAVSVPFVDRH